MARYRSVVSTAAQHSAGVKFSTRDGAKAIVVAVAGKCDRVGISPDVVVGHRDKVVAACPITSAHFLRVEAPVGAIRVRVKTAAVEATG